MKLILGIDVGGSTTKIVGYNEEKQLVGELQVKASDQLTSLYGALGNFLRTQGLSLMDVSNVVLTGVGASLISDYIYGIPVHKVDEFEAIGYGGLKLSGLDDALVVSIGTGTAYVRASRERIFHIGGSGVGGGTLSGLAFKLINEQDTSIVSALAKDGVIENVDLLIGDISEGEIATLPLTATASNFGSIKNIASDADLAYGLINMVFQTAGMLAVFACLNDTTKDIVLTGTMTTIPRARECFDMLSEMHGVNFIIPEHAVFATAIGATSKFMDY